MPRLLCFAGSLKGDTEWAGRSDHLTRVAPETVHTEGKLAVHLVVQPLLHPFCLSRHSKQPQVSSTWDGPSSLLNPH